MANAKGRRGGQKRAASEQPPETEKNVVAKEEDLGDEMEEVDLSDDQQVALSRSVSTFTAADDKRNDAASAVKNMVLALGGKEAQLVIHEGNAKLMRPKPATDD